MGDGAFGMSGTDIETAARSGFAITTVLVNNSSMATYAGAARGAIGAEARQFPTTGELSPPWADYSIVKHTIMRARICVWFGIGILNLLNLTGPSSVQDGMQPTSRPEAQVPSTAYGVSMMNGDYAKIAEGMGAVGITCTKVSELGPAIMTARELNAAGTTCLIQVQANVEERRSNNFKFADGVDSGEQTRPQFQSNFPKVPLAHTLNVSLKVCARVWVQLCSDMVKLRQSSKI